MANWLRGFITNTGVVGELFTALWHHRRWWLIPMVVILVAIGLLLVLASTSGIGPFIYALF